MRNLSIAASLAALGLSFNADIPSFSASPRPIRHGKFSGARKIQRAAKKARNKRRGK